MYCRCHAGHVHITTIVTRALSLLLFLSTVLSVLPFSLLLFLSLLSFSGVVMLNCTVTSSVTIVTVSTVTFAAVGLSSYDADMDCYAQYIHVGG